MKRKNRERGASLVEVLVAIALAGLMLPAFAEASLVSHADRPMANQRLQAESLEREAMEAVRVVREAGWSGVSTTGTYHPAISGNTWTLASGSETIGTMTRQIVIASVQRSTTGTVVGSGGTVDPNTVLVTVTVSWTKPANGSVSTQTYLTRWRSNAVWVQTSQADFNGGTLANTSSTAGGTVQLQDNPATWQLPSTVGSYDITGNVSGLCVAYTTIASVPYALVGYATGVAVVNVSNPASPTLTGTFTTTGAVNGIFASGSTAYLATAIRGSQFIIVNLSTPSAPTQTSAIAVGGNAAANGVYVSGTFAYVVKAAETGANGEFNVVNISNPAAPAAVGKLARQSANFNAVYVSGNFAYVATAQTNAQFRVINVTTPTAPTSSATVNLTVTANDITLNGTTAYIVTANNGSSGELQIYNVTTPTAPTAIGNYQAGGSITGVGLDTTNPNYVLLATSVATKQMIIVNVSVPATPALVNNVNYGSTTNKVVVSGSYAYFATANTTQGLAILFTGYRPSGTFESSTFDAGASVGLNNLSFTIAVPAGTTLQFQVAANNTGSGWSYVGPDGTNATFYSAEGMIPISIAANRYFRYKASLTTTNGQQTPVISDVTLNYSP